MKSLARVKALVLVVFLFILPSAAQFARVASGSRIMISAHPLAAKAGLEVYHKGGNVVDVAVAVAYALGVVEPHGSGIGGEGMMLIYNAKEKKSTVVDFKGISPNGASYHTLDLDKKSEWARSAKGASVPGAVAGLELARETFGKLDRKTVLQPAVDYALQGFEVDSTLALNLESYRRILEKDPYTKSLYYGHGQVPKIGTLLKNPDYGKSLQTIQSGGADAFYKGVIADLIVRDIQKRGGFITKEDLLSYRPLLREPLVGEYRGHTIMTTPPPCGGIFLIEALNILKFFDLQECRKNNDYNLHLFAEMSKLMYKDEATHNGDPAFSTIPVVTVTSDAYAFQRFLHIDLAHARAPEQIEAGRIADKNTTQLCVMDIEGNTVSLTITLSSLFGTGQTIEGGGFILNNEMQNFNIDPKHPNSLQPHKRVVTSLVPTIILKDGRPLYTVGTPGGDLILSTVAQVIVNLIDFKMPLREAVYAPRMFSIYSQRELEIENRFPATSLLQLETLGHEVKRSEAFRAYFGAVQSIMYDARTNLLIGCSDPRRSGAAVGE
ncbi:MAG: gamma-glutamyltransferase [Ignavibacteriales bacterium]|nr:gamma-glutamyltransferase [Ignavibacteriales bacterium]